MVNRVGSLHYDFHGKNIRCRYAGLGLTSWNDFQQAPEHSVCHCLNNCVHLKLILKLNSQHNRNKNRTSKSLPSWMNEGLIKGLEGVSQLLHPSHHRKALLFSPLEDSATRHHLGSRGQFTQNTELANIFMLEFPASRTMNNTLLLFINWLVGGTLRDSGPECEPNKGGGWILALDPVVARHAHRWVLYHLWELAWKGHFFQGQEALWCQSIRHKICCLDTCRKLSDNQVWSSSTARTAFLRRSQITTISSSASSIFLSHRFLWVGCRTPRRVHLLCRMMHRHFSQRSSPTPREWHYHARAKYHFEHSCWWHLFALKESGLSNTGVLVKEQAVQFNQEQGFTCMDRGGLRLHFINF